MIVKRKPKVELIDIDEKLNKIAAFLLIPAADVVQVVAKAIGVPPCESCQLRYQIWKRAAEFGWHKVLYMTAKSIRAQLRNDKRAIEKLSEELK